MRKISLKVFRIGTVRYKWPMSASQAFGIAHCTDSEDLPISARYRRTCHMSYPHIQALSRISPRVRVWVSVSIVYRHLGLNNFSE